VPPSAAELNARADIEGANASSAPPGDAEALRGIAAVHRRAAKVLLDREESICVGLPEADRAHPPFLSWAALDGVRPVMGERRLVKSSVQEVRGAQLIVRATAGMTRQWLARQVRCHIAWHDVVGPRAPDGLDDPFMVGAPEISFDEAETGFIIRVQGTDKAEGEEILRRALRLVSPGDTPSLVP
jgi:hypothetical protein